MHGRSFICNPIGFDAVTRFVYSAPVQVRYQNWAVFENAFKSGAFSKLYGFIGRVNIETA